MRSRCSNPRTKEWAAYGGRGIRVCDEWQDFDQFLRDMGPAPSSAHSIDRIDVDGDYEPLNCRWATHVEQNRNKRDNHIVRINGRAITISEAAEIAGVSHSTMSSRVRRGWTGPKLLTQLKGHHV
jgi:hypothetical protein